MRKTALTHTCQQCGTTFERKASKKGVYCSHPCYWTAKKGKSVPNGRLGTKASAETRAKMSVSQRNRVRLPETGAKISKAKLGKPRMDMRGDKHWCWNPDRSQVLQPDRLRGTLEWKQWRRAVFARDNYTCKECGANKCYIEPHHVIPVRTIRDNHDLLFDMRNGITLCRPCHDKTKGKEALFEERYSSMTA